MLSPGNKYLFSPCQAHMIFALTLGPVHGLLSTSGEWIQIIFGFPPLSIPHLMRGGNDENRYFLTFYEVVNFSITEKSSSAFIGLET